MTIFLNYLQRSLSLPSRERGLKSYEEYTYIMNTPSLPSRERGLKSESTADEGMAEVSLPSRERGLKYRQGRAALVPACRSPRGSVD